MQTIILPKLQNKAIRRIQFNSDSQMNDKKIANYTITSQTLGKGSFSTVYLGYTDSREKVAVKVIPREKIQENQVKFFLNEINLLKKCHSQYIVRFIDIQKSKANFYIFLEFCNQGNLEEYIKKKNFLEEKQAMDIFIQLVRGMNVMKKLNVIHRDIKPANIMFHDGKAKYVDFGLATKFNDSGKMMETFAGSPFNMAPQMLYRRPYDDKVDIYSLGTVLYQMVFGVRPFNGTSYEELIANVQGRKFNHPKNKVKVSGLVREILKGMLAQRPQKRLSYSQLTQLVAKYEKEQENKIVQIYKKYEGGALNFCNLFAGIAAPLLGMYLPLGKALWEKNFTNLLNNQVEQNMKFLFQDYKCTTTIKKNPWDMDLRLSCSLHRALYQQHKAKQRC